MIDTPVRPAVAADETPTAPESETTKQPSQRVGLRPEQNPEAMQRLRRIAKAYYGRSNWHGLRVVAYDWAVIFGAAAICEVLRLNTPLWVFLPAYALATLVIGSRFRGMENLVHEASHYNMFKTRSWNDNLEFLFALPVFRTAEDFRRSHNIHHRSLGHEDIDPDLRRYEAWGVRDLPKNYWWIMVIRPLTGWLTYHWFVYELKAFIKSPTHRASKIIFWAAVFAAFAITGIWTQVLLYWVIPFFIVLPVPRFWSVISEHGGLDLRHDIASSRNTLGSALQQWIIFPHNDGYHETHHLYPSIPWYLIHEADAELMEDPYYNSYVSHSQNLYTTAEQMMHNTILTFQDELPD
jgi:fatty acid desaturase